MAISSDRSRFYLLNHDGNTLLQKFNLPLSPSAPDHVHLLGSCNGLFCLGIFSKYSPKFKNFNVFCNPILWNPLLNDYQKVPFNVSNIVNWFGFGYDSHAEDYKLVRVKMNEAEVYSLKSSSIKRVPFQQLPVTSSGLHHHFGRFFNGSLYWISFNDPSEPEFIIFDLRYDIFRFLKFPNCTLPDEQVKFCDCLGVFLCDPENNEFFNLVTMKEDSENDNMSWSRIEIRSENLSWNICFTMNDEILERLNNKHRSPPNRKNDVHLIEIDEAEHWYEYIETLVLPSKLIAPSACLLA